MGGNDESGFCFPRATMAAVSCSKVVRLNFASLIDPEEQPVQSYFHTFVASTILE